MLKCLKLFECEVKLKLIINKNILVLRFYFDEDLVCGGSVMFFFKRGKVS